MLQRKLFLLLAFGIFMDDDISVVVACCDVTFLLGLGKCSEEGISHLDHLNLFLLQTVIGDFAGIPSSYNLVGDELYLPVHHNLAFDGDGSELAGFKVEEAQGGIHAAGHQVGAVVVES